MVDIPKDVMPLRTPLSELVDKVVSVAGPLTKLVVNRELTRWTPFDPDMLVLEGKYIYYVAMPPESKEPLRDDEDRKLYDEDRMVFALVALETLLEVGPLETLAVAQGLATWQDWLMYLQKPLAEHFQVNPYALVSEWISRNLPRLLSGRPLSIWRFKPGEAGMAGITAIQQRSRTV
ncbi:MAG: hypothetical protein EHM14_15760 [Methanothrix sp.]|nr:MAG: hypothetical protein EHM14_15760 [Methanothrix sp.]